MTDRAFPWRPVGVLGLGLFGFGLAVGSFGTYVEGLIATGVSPDAAGLGSTLFLLGQLVFVYPSDVVTRRWSVRAMAAVGLALGAVGTGLGGVLSVPVNYAARLVLGFGLSGTFLAAMKYAGRRAPRGSTARVQGVLGATFTLGLAVGIPAVPPVVEAVGPVWPAALTALPLAASALLAPSLVRVPTDRYRPPAAYVEAFRNPAGLALGLGNAASYGLLVVATTWYTDVVTGTPALPATLVLAGFAAATFVGRTWSGWLTAFTTERRAVGGSLLFLAGALVLVAAALAVGSPPLLAVGLVLTGAGFGLPFGPLNSLAFANLGNDPGVLLVGMGVLGYGAALVYPWLVGWLLGATRGYAAGFVVLGVSVFLVGVAWWRVMSDGRR
jgi:DHA1 family inner membrane transport protein